MNVGKGQLDSKLLRVVYEYGIMGSLMNAEEYGDEIT